MSDRVAEPIPPGYIRCFVTGKLRADTPEEHVRQRWARSLVYEYHYPKTDLGIEVWITMGRSRKRADLVVYGNKAPHIQERIQIIIETKRDDRNPSDGDHGEGQLKSYMAACNACKFGLWVGRERRAFEKIPPPDSGYALIADIPRFGADQPQLPTRDALVPAHELKSVFRRCHNFIYTNSGLSKEDIFHELVKLIFCKMFDEEESGTALQFAVQPQERLATSGQRRLMEDRLMPLFRRVQERYRSIFANDVGIKLEMGVAAYVVSELQYISLLDTGADVKGAAYEELVGSDLHGDRGQYFTPRNVCDMAVHMTMALHKEEDIAGLKILDCCCGTGGFLISWLNNLYDLLLSQEKIRTRIQRRPEEIARERVRKVCQNKLFGLDISGLLVRACQMNMVLHGDGSSNIYEANSVWSPGEWCDDARNGIPYGEIDVLITNPPFGSGTKIDDAHVLGQYELPDWERRNALSTLPAEQLFIEAALKFLKPGGYLVIVIPDGILNNPGLRFIRSWLLHRSKIVASVDLPKTTFAANHGVKNPSLLIVQRFMSEDQSAAEKGVVDMDYDVFMTAPRTSGIDQRSNPIFLQHGDGSVKLDKHGNRIRNDEISTVPEAFTAWLESK